MTLSFTSCAGEHRNISLWVSVYITPSLDALMSCRPNPNKEVVTVSVQIDEELANRAREVVGKVGFTLEQVTEMFLSWCALYPDDASAWLKKAMEELGIKPRNSSMQDEE